jgi:NADPH-dependent curcumin reductase CurA
MANYHSYAPVSLVGQSGRKQKWPICGDAHGNGTVASGKNRFQLSSRLETEAPDGVEVGFDAYSPEALSHFLAEGETEMFGGVERREGQGH